MAKVKAKDLDGKSVAERAKIVAEKGFEVMLARLNGAPVEADQVLLAMTASRLGMVAEKMGQLQRQYRVSKFWSVHASGLVPSPIILGRSKYWRRDELADWVMAGCPPRTRWQWHPDVPNSRAGGCHER